MGAWIARRISGTHARRGEPTEVERARARALRDWAVEKLRGDRDLDLVVLGHTHVPALDEVEEGRYYLNAGDWVHHRSYAVLERGSPPRLERWEK